MVTFLLEVGTEELPASFVADALEQWRSRIPASLKEQFLTPETIDYYGTPRRLAVLLHGLPTQQPDREEEVKGPSAQAAFKDGKPTKAAEGFARSRNVSIDDFEIRSTDKGDFVFVNQKIPGRPTADILTELIPDWIFGLEGKRFMRWGDGDLRFPRPIRWLVTLLDDAVLPIRLENGSEVCVSDRLSQGHRVLHPEAIAITNAADYLTQLEAASIQVDPDRRKAAIQQQTVAAATSVGGVALIDSDLLEEVVDLVEYPTAVVGKFDPEFLELPPEVIISEMKDHQRYFPVLKAEGSTELLPYFITISNGDPTKSDIIAAGNERVIRARLSDGKFFFDADRKIPLEGYLPKLETVTFQEKLGSVRAKVDRIVRIAGQISDQLKLNDSSIQRAALLCKADLVTQMVGEFPELQGVMGQKYALTSGEGKAVADAIFEHYLPRGAGDQLPQTLPGQVVGIADRLDTLVGIFSLGMIPSGSSDPFALRRAANAIVNIIWSANLTLNLEQQLDQVIADVIATFGENEHTPRLQPQLHEFFLQRIRTLLQDDRQIDYDLVNAVLGENDPDYTERALKDLLDVRDRALFLQSIRQNGALDAIYETVNRSTRLAGQGDLDKVQLDPKSLIQPKLFQSPSEQAFYDALVKLVPQTQEAQANRDYQKLVDGLTAIAPVVSNFFDGPESVLVMDENPDIRRNRLNLLGVLRNHARVLADFGAIVKGA
ncbi:glycine--tRNA ligase subunit beta [Oscillatoria sp. FACHB-1407]|uniref:glycine--tRNA ligase subunit beta n=1 Tax=Oscillatoria sp. FACHB-1407 TaxID=2692847 RepID=UPI001685BDC4|nr:glycine--tRNA ligase subunit beta [Oscillatoria sp. FACHB-1407]MBD2459914.1 glycine--tRNA ligase subunit beta [Oscillatoria sp. FACHB-1407]